MALDAGSIDVSDPENPTGSGLSWDMFQAAMGAVPPEHKAAVAGSLGPYFQGQAGAIIDHFKNHAVIVVVVHTTDVGLQRMSNPLAADANAQGPSTDKNLQGTIG
jgi:hypothetical protein